MTCGALCDFTVRSGLKSCTAARRPHLPSLRAGPGYLNLIAEGEQKRWLWWGRIIFHVDDVDACYARALKAGHQPSTVPRDAEWGERYFHLTDPDGHELSFARPLRSSNRTSARQAGLALGRPSIRRTK
jgi:catechol 2,3-dioxygenase-like lactoylglutathione lyase family enzyme